jgi:hypothetical protein
MFDDDFFFAKHICHVLVQLNNDTLIFVLKEVVIGIPRTPCHRDTRHPKNAGCVYLCIRHWPLFMSRYWLFIRMVV